MSSATTPEPPGALPHPSFRLPSRLALPAVLGLHAVVWTLAAWLSRGNLDPAGDMIENYVWGIEWQAGYQKHPPLFAWITAAWFTLMPRADAAYYLLSALNAGVGLLGVAALARRFVGPDSAMLAAVALGVSPLYTALAIKFNANAVLLSLWPWAAYHFVVFMQGGLRRHAAACGALTALALLGKYFSLMLVLGLVLTALANPPWRKRLQGAGPWIALGAGAVVLAPHVMWQFDQQFATLRYASQRSAGSLDSALLQLFNYGVAQIGYLLPSALLLLGAVAPGRRREAARCMARALVQPALHPALWWLAAAPMIAIAAVALLGRTPMASVWGMAQWFAITALWVAVLAQQGNAPRVDWLRRALPVYWVSVTLIAAAIGAFEARGGSAGAAEPRAELAQLAHALWRERTGRELRIVAGTGVEASAVAFYAPGKARWWNPSAPAATPWLRAADWQREGGLLVCSADDSGCDRLAVAIDAGPAIDVAPHKHAWGLDLAPRRYRLYLRVPT